MAEARLARRARLICVLVAMAVVAGVAAAPAGAGAQPLARGFADDVWASGGPTWMSRTTATGARYALLEVDWNGVEPTAPVPGRDPTDPAAPQYSFGGLDALVRQFAGAGITPVFLVTFAPAWAQARGGPPALVAQGAWRPNATAYGQLARALARRYSGGYPDPLHPGRWLPRVSHFQAWAEANLTVRLAPQWTRSGSSFVSAAPGIYRGMLNAFYDGVKSVHRDNVVIASGLAPYGDPAGDCRSQSLGNGCRMRPARFMRDLMCLSDSLTPLRCANPARLDVIAADPYEVGAPTTAAVNTDDVSAPDLWKLTRIAAKAVSAGRTVPRSVKGLWVTEFSYESNPPNPYAFSTATQARWMDEAFYIFWKQGVSAVFWYLMRDQPGRDWAHSYFSGVYFYGGGRKPSFQAYRFPFVVKDAGRSATAWGISPRTGWVYVQQQQGRGWRTLFRTWCRAGAWFSGSVSIRLRGQFKAVISGESSAVWRR